MVFIALNLVISSTRYSTLYNSRINIIPITLVPLILMDSRQPIIDNIFKKEPIDKYKRKITPLYIREVSYTHARFYINYNTSCREYS